MTIEEIKYASKDYVNYLLDKQEYHNENYTEDDIRQAFEKGAMFINNNPDISSLWHKAIKEDNIEKESELYAQSVVGELSEDIRHLLETAYIAGVKRIMK